MQNQLNIEKTDWKKFWNSYRNITPNTQEDLFYQVGKTVHGKPIPITTYLKSIDRIIKLLKLCSNDQLLELCCGNGLITYELSKHVDQIIAIDFANHLIDTAKKFKYADNISYIQGDVTHSLDSYLLKNFFPTKIFMGVGLAYFDLDKLEIILKNAINHNKENPFSVLFTDVPNIDLLKNYYNTQDRWDKYCSNQKNSENGNDGIGRWWSVLELNEIAQKIGLTLEIYEQPIDLSNYRFDVVFTKS